MLTKVVIDSITVKDDSSGSDPKYLVNWEYERTNEIEISILNMNLLKSVVDVVSLNVGKTVEIWAGSSTSTDKKVFSGYISAAKLVGGVYEVECKDKMWDLIRKNVNNIYEISGPQAGKISEIAKDLIETYGGLTADVEDTGTESGRILEEYRCIFADVYGRLKNLALAVNYQIVYDADTDKVNFKSQGFVNNGTILSTDTNIISLPEWEDDTSQMVNDLRVDGAVSLTQLRFPTTGAGQIGTTSGFETTGITLPKTPENVELLLDASNPPTTIKEGGSKDGSTGNDYYVDRVNSIVYPVEGSSFTSGHYAIVNYSWYAPAPIHQQRPDSIVEFGKFEKQTTLSDIITVADAEARTNEILDRFSQPFTLGTFLVKADVDIEVGETVRVIDNINTPVDADFVITKQVIKYPASSQEITVGDEPRRLADWQYDIDERLKRLEENLINQDLILELFNFANSSRTQPRYRKVIKENYDETSGISMWGFGTSDGYYDWGSGKWGTSADAFLPEEEHFVQQYQNTYTEEFIDTDFEDTGTATWNTSTGTLIFD